MPGITHSYWRGFPLVAPTLYTTLYTHSHPVSRLSYSCLSFLASHLSSFVFCLPFTISCFPYLVFHLQFPLSCLPSLVSPISSSMSRFPYLFFHLPFPQSGLPSPVSPILSSISHFPFLFFYLQGWKFANSLIAHLLICSDCSSQMSDCERFAQIAKDK